MQPNIQNQNIPANIRMTKKAQQAKTIILQQLQKQNIQTAVQTKQFCKPDLPQKNNDIPSDNKITFSKQHNKGKIIHMYKSALFENKFSNGNEQFTNQQNKMHPFGFNTQPKTFFTFNKSEKKVEQRVPSFLKKTDKKLIQRGQRRSSMVQSDIMERPNQDKILQEHAIQENKNSLNYQLAEIMLPNLDKIQRKNKTKTIFAMKKQFQNSYQQENNQRQLWSHQQLSGPEPNFSDKDIKANQMEAKGKEKVYTHKQQNLKNQLTNEQPNEQISKPLVLDDFEIGELLGKGSFGSVHIVRHKETGFFFALKTYSKKQIGQKLDRYIHCIKLQMFCRHPNIAQLYSVFVEGQKVYWLMQLCMDGDLSTQVKRLKNRKQQTKHIVRNIIKGLQYLHQNQIIHRDIKLENVLLSYGLPKITDFDLSIYQPDPSQSRRTFCGSPMYFSPEMLSNESYTNKVDVWCLGIICYELTCGYYPFEVGKYGDINNIVHLEPKSFPQNIDDQTKNFIQKMLTKNPEQRAYWRQLIHHPYFLEDKRK